VHCNTSSKRDDVCPRELFNVYDLQKEAYDDEINEIGGVNR
jgi:hypothetical protein